jgi:RND family efflux transporter MFP subunit
VPERFTNFVHVGQQVRVGVDAYPGKTFTGAITRVSPTSEVANRSITIEAIVPNPDGLLKPGFFTRGELVYDTAGEAVAVPERALTTFAGVTKVFVVADGKAGERVVRVGPGSQDGLREIEDGVKSGEQVAVSKVEELEQGMPVTTSEPVAAGGGSGDS